MGSPTIFNGKFTKLLTQRGILNSDGRLNENDGPKNLIKNGTFETGLQGWQLGTITNFSLPPTPGAADLEMLLDTTNPINGTASLIVQNKATSAFWPQDQGFFYYIGNTGLNSDQNTGCFTSFRWQLPDISQIGNADWSGTFPNSTFRHYIFTTAYGGLYIDPGLYDPLGVKQVNGYFPQPNGDLINYLFGGASVPASDVYWVVVAFNSSTGPITLKFDDIAYGQPPADMVADRSVSKLGGYMSGDLYVPNVYVNDKVQTNLINDYTSATGVTQPYPLTITSQDNYGVDTNEVIVKSGNAFGTDKNSGNITIQTGEITSSSGLSSPKTGDINIVTGNDQTGTETTGSLFINTGSGTGGTSASGNIVVETGFSSTSRGTVSLSGLKSYIESNANSVDEINETKIIIGKDGNLNKARPFEFTTSTGIFTLGPSDTSNYSIIFPESAPNPLNILQYDNDTNKLIWVPYMPSLSDVGTKFSYASSTIDTYGGVTAATSGTLGTTPYNITTFLTRFPTIGFQTTSVAGTTTGCRIASNPPAVGRGLYFETLFQITDAALVPLGRHFCGFNDTATGSPYNASTNTSPILNDTNIFGMGWDGYAGDTNFYIYTNDNSGTATKIDLGAAFTSTANKIYKVVFYSPKGQQAIYYNICILNTSGIVTDHTSGVVTTKLPTVAFYTHNERFNGGSNLVAKFSSSALKLFVE